MNRFTVTVSYTYDVSDRDLVDHYDTINLEEAALIDERNLERMPSAIIEDIQHISSENLTIHVKAEPLD